MARDHVEAGAAATFGRSLVDNTVFWISEDERGARQAWRANGYNPLRISTHAVEVALTACMRKLLTIVNAILRDRTPWHAQELSA